MLNKEMLLTGVGNFGIVPQCSIVAHLWDGTMYPWGNATTKAAETGWFGWTNSRYTGGKNGVINRIPFWDEGDNVFVLDEVSWSADYGESAGIEIWLKSQNTTYKHYSFSLLLIGSPGWVARPDMPNVDEQGWIGETVLFQRAIQNNTDSLWLSSDSVITDTTDVPKLVSVNQLLNLYFEPAPTGYI